MSMQKRCTALLITAASSALLVSCASSRDVAAAAATHQPIVVDNYNTPSAAELYAQRFPSSVMQVTKGEQYRFVSCADSCSGATPKTPTTNLYAEIVRRAQANLQARSRAAISSETVTVVNPVPTKTVSPDVSIRSSSAAAPKLLTAVSAREAARDANQVTAPSARKIADATVTLPAEDTTHTRRAR